MDRIWQLKISKLSIAETYTIITGEVIQCPETGYFDNESVPCELMSAGRILMELQVSDIWVEPQNDDNEILFFTEHLIPESFQSYIDEGLFLCSPLGAKVFVDKGEEISPKLGSPKEWINKKSP